jgi:SWI/SNF-related matrix-associated actin-dependent regulator 1 of chromatin subfamily A
LSGTPIENNAIEFFNILNLINKRIFPSRYNFGMAFCNPQRSDWTKSGWEFTGVSNVEKLNEHLTKHIMIRRTKEEVLPELPKASKIIIPVEIANRKEYNFAEENFIQWLIENYGEKKADKAIVAEAFVKIQHLKNLIVEGKMPSILEWISDFIQKGKLVVGAWHQNVVETIHKKFKNSLIVYGKNTVEKNQANVDKFQEDPKIKLLIANIKSGGTGHDLVAANATCTIELMWNPSKHEQFDDRIARIGQKHESIFNYYIIGENTYEESILKIIDDKKNLITSIFEGQMVSEKESMLEMLLKSTLKKRR